MERGQVGCGDAGCRYWLLTCSSLSVSHTKIYLPYISATASLMTAPFPDFYPLPHPSTRFFKNPQPAMLNSRKVPGLKEGMNGCKGPYFKHPPSIPCCFIAHLNKAIEAPTTHSSWSELTRGGGCCEYSPSPLITHSNGLICTYGSMGCVLC
jgi:hypothetical protein